MIHIVEFRDKIQIFAVSFQYMATSTKEIREYIGNDQIEQALKALLELLEDREGDHDLHDQSILQKGRWADYKKRDMGGFADDKEANSIRAALLNITRELETRMKQPATPKTDPPPVPLPKPPEPPRNPYVAQCHFNGDMNAYYVLPNNQIMMLNPATNLSVVVASRAPSAYPNIAWVYLFPNGFFYNIDHAGAIWGVNAFGMPMQMGYVEYFT
jgi:hypothetical protein